MLLLMVFWYSCVPVPEDNQEEVIIDLQDEEIRKIYSLQDKQHADSLKLYFTARSATERYLAAMAFASFQTPEVIGELASLLFDKNDQVKEAAAYALGQIGDPASVNLLLEAFDSDDQNVNSDLNMTILEAIGKCGDQKMLDFMATASNYTLEDDKLLLGQARGIYRFALRGISSEAGTKRMSDLVVNTAFPLESRVVAANYLYRAVDLDITNYKFQLLKTLTEETDPRIRMCLINALAKTQDDEILPNLLDLIKSEKDYRVVVNGIRGLQNFNTPSLIDSLLPYVSGQNDLVALTAMDVITPKAQRTHTNQLRELSNTIADSEIRAKLLGASLKSAPFSYRNTKRLITNQIESEYGRAGTEYKKSFFLEALSQDPSNYQKILTIGRDAVSYVIRTKAISSLENVLSSPNFNNIYRSSRSRDQVKMEILDFLTERISTGDLGEIAASGELMVSQADQLSEVFSDSLTLVTELRKINGPEGIEAKKSLGQALAALSEHPYVEPDPTGNQLMDWTVLDNISSGPLAIIVTTKGRITVELKPQLAPETVANFINLTDNNFYDRKFIHRVVPNFVIQGGCPRGDGYGSLDYTIRSELPKVYYDKQGYIGMASAGNHTEGTQWFITHSPTPHLDGRYTIFGEVTEGMDVVHQMRVGDIIQDIRILKYN